MQTVALADNVIAREGMVETNMFVSSFANTDAAGLPAGRFVVRDVTDINSIRVPVLTGEVTGLLIEGVSIWLPSREPQDPEYAEFDMVSVLRMGRIWMVAEDAVTITDQVFVRFASGGGGTELGTVRSDADTATAVAQPRCRFLSVTTGALELVLVEVSLP